jgi:diguanylate cyclase (GGDEF)-like protein
MRGHIQSVVFAVLAAFLASLWAAPAMAHKGKPDEPIFSPACHAASGLETTIGDMGAGLNTQGAPGTDRWTCSQSDWVAHEPVAWLLFDSDIWQGEKRPRYFLSQIARYQTITFAALDADGSIRSLEWSEADAHPFTAGPVFQLELPEIGPQTEALIVRIERPHSIPLLTEARLTSLPEDAEWSLVEVLILAFVIGMLVLPLFFDISFFLVLRERFVLLHALMVISMIGYVMSAGGLISVFATVPLKAIAIMAPLLWAIGVGISALFLADFLEEGAQSKTMKKLTVAAAIWTFALPGFAALQLHATQTVDDRLYFYGFIPVIAIITAAIGEAVSRGSRSAVFIAVAWTPIILASIERLLRGVGVYGGSPVLDQAMFVATGIEVIVISLAIADRFLAIRRERDEAVAEARTLERLSERDALTGLLNRRGLEARFKHLFKTGFDTFALIDLDRFKQVNDRYGHQMGDAALIACARALESHNSPDLVAARLGGEEFVVLLRGENALERADALRQAIPSRIAADVPGIGMAVSASSGAVEVPRTTRAMMSFEEFYARADALMYDAKASGRNRMVSEKITIFQNTSIRGKSGRGSSGRALPTPANSDQAA